MSNRRSSSNKRKSPHTIIKMSEFEFANTSTSAGQQYALLVPETEDGGGVVVDASNSAKAAPPRVMPMKGTLMAPPAAPLPSTSAASQAKKIGTKRRLTIAKSIDVESDEDKSLNHHHTVQHSNPEASKKSRRKTICLERKIPPLDEPSKSSSSEFSFRYQIQDPNMESKLQKIAFMRASINYLLHKFGIQAINFNLRSSYEVLKNTYEMHRMKAGIMTPLAMQGNQTKN